MIPSRLVLLLALAGAAGSAPLAADHPGPSRASAPWTSVTVQLDLGGDTGESWGSLFEVRDRQGSVVVGAGFLDAYNTQDRSDRRMLQVYAHLPAADGFARQRLPNPSSDAGTYLFGQAGQIFAKGRASVTDQQLRRWDADRHAWRVDTNTVPFSVEIAGRSFRLADDALRYQDVVVLELPPGAGRLAEPYAAAGWLVCRRVNPATSPAENELLAARWRPGDPPLNPAALARLSLPDPREFIYCYGSHCGELLAVSNMGGVHALGEQGWRTARQANPQVSFQVYASLRLGPRLLLGQYPSGELFEWNGQELLPLRGAPPVMPGVSSAAREAQTLALYGGRLYAGVWPWGEVWRAEPELTDWRLLGRMFSHPDPTDATVHPYENETKALDPVLNRWGQRVTSMLPWGDSLYIATSAKASTPYEDKFQFMDRTQADEYGAVYRHYVPGTLSVPLDLARPETTLRIRWNRNALRIEQDGVVRGQTRWQEPPLTAEAHAVLPNQGLFGQGTRTRSARLVVEPPPSPAPWLAAFVHLDRIANLRKGADECRRQFGQMLDRFQAAGLQTVMPYANTSSGATYFPSQTATRQVVDGWDPLGVFLAEARARNLAVWPAVCVLVSGNFQPQGILLDHPEWALRQTDGQPWGFLSPAHPDARAWVLQLLEEIARSYQPEGVLLDYLRYFNRPYLLDSAAEDLVRLRCARLAEGPARDAAIQELRQQYLSSLAEAISRRLRATLPSIQIGLYTWGPHVAQNHRVAQDWPTWVQRGWLDLVNVSGYYYVEKNGAQALTLFENRLREALQLTGGADRPVAVTVGLGVHTSHGSLTSADVIDEYLQRAANVGLDGVGVFTWPAFEPFAEELARRKSLAPFLRQNP